MAFSGGDVGMESHRSRISSARKFGALDFFEAVRRNQGAMLRMCSLRAVRVMIIIEGEWRGV